MNNEVASYRHNIFKYALALILVLSQYNLFGQSEPIGFNADEFYQIKDSLMESIHDVLQNADDSSESYENNMLRASKGRGLKDNIERKRITIKDWRIARLTFFLGYIAGIELDMGDRYHYFSNSPLRDRMETLLNFYSKGHYDNIYPYWILYNLTDYMYAETYANPMMTEQITLDDHYKDDEFKYAHENPDKRLSKDILITDAVSKAEEYLNGILKSK